MIRVCFEDVALRHDDCFEVIDSYYNRGWVMESFVIGSDWLIATARFRRELSYSESYIEVKK